MMAEPNGLTKSQPAVMATKPARIPFNVNENDGYNIQMFSDILQTELMANSRKVQQGDYDVPHTSADYANMDVTISYKPETSWNYEVGACL